MTPIESLESNLHRIHNAQTAFMSAVEFALPKSEISEVRATFFAELLTLSINAATLGLLLTPNVRHDGELLGDFFDMLRRSIISHYDTNWAALVPEDLRAKLETAMKEHRSSRHGN